MKELYGYDYAKTCPLIYALTVVGARWKLPIVWYLTEEDGLHYNELRRRVKGITDTALARCLHELEDDGILTRRRQDHADVSHLSFDGNWKKAHARAKGALLLGRGTFRAY